MTNTIQRIKMKAIPILKEAQVIRSSLFGSYARGEETEESDIDMLVQLPKGKSLLDLVRLERALRIAIGKKIDLLTYNSIHPSLKANIQKDQLDIL